VVAWPVAGLDSCWTELGLSKWKLSSGSRGELARGRELVGAVRCGAPCRRGLGTCTFATTAPAVLVNRVVIGALDSFLARSMRRSPPSGGQSDLGQLYYRPLQANAASVAVGVTPAFQRARHSYLGDTARPSARDEAELVRPSPFMAFVWSTDLRHRRNG
jgi:hypothetical protein